MEWSTRGGRRRRLPLPLERYILDFLSLPDLREGCSLACRELRLQAQAVADRYSGHLAPSHIPSGGLTETARRALPHTVGITVARTVFFHGRRRACEYPEKISRLAGAIRRNASTLQRLHLSPPLPAPETALLGTLLPAIGRCFRLTHLSYRSGGSWPALGGTTVGPEATRSLFVACPLLCEVNGLQLSASGLLRVPPLALQRLERMELRMDIPTTGEEGLTFWDSLSLGGSSSLQRLLVRLEEAFAAPADQPPLQRLPVFPNLATLEVDLSFEKSHALPPIRAPRLFELSGFFRDDLSAWVVLERFPALRNLSATATSADVADARTAGRCLPAQSRLESLHLHRASLTGFERLFSVAPAAPLVSVSDALRGLSTLTADVRIPESEAAQSTGLVARLLDALPGLSFLALHCAVCTDPVSGTAAAPTPAAAAPDSGHAIRRHTLQHLQVAFHPRSRSRPALLQNLTHRLLGLRELHLSRLDDAFPLQSLLRHTISPFRRIHLEDCPNLILDGRDGGFSVTVRDSLELILAREAEASSGRPAAFRWEAGSYPPTLEVINCASVPATAREWLALSSPHTPEHAKGRS